MWINRIKWRDGKTNVRDTKTDEEIIKMVYIIPNSKTVDKFLLASRADKPSFAQTRCAQTMRSVTAASAKLVTKLDQGSRIRPVHRDCCIHEMFHVKH